MQKYLQFHWVTNETFPKDELHFNGIDGKFCSGAIVCKKCKKEKIKNKEN